MPKIYEETTTSRFYVECMYRMCDYYSECRYPPIYCDSHISNIDGKYMEIKEFVKGRKSTPGEFSFYSMCRRDDFKEKFNKEKLNEFIKLSSEYLNDTKFDYEKLREELKQMNLWEE